MRNYLFVINHNIVACWDIGFDAPFAEQCSRYNVEIVGAIVSFARREESHVQVAAIMINGAAAAIK